MGLDDDPYVAYCVDEAIFAVGVEIEAELAEIDAKDPKKAQRKREEHLRRRLGLKSQLFAPPPQEKLSARRI